MLILDDEREFVILAAIADLGGFAKRERVLAHVATQGYLRLTDSDRQPNRSRDEARWRTDLSYLVFSMRERGYLIPTESETRSGHWSVTELGLQRLRDLAQQIGSTQDFRILDSTALVRSYELI